jgi:heme exporter protein A
MIILSATKLTKYFGSRLIFRDLSFSIAGGDSLLVTGPNGSGKSTLIKVLIGFLRPTRGELNYTYEGRPVEGSARNQKLGWVAPDLELYGELSALENLQFFNKLHNANKSDGDLLVLLARVGLQGREQDWVRTYSSGMKQRLKYAFALLHSPDILFLDEPTANLDEKGKEIVRQIIEDQKKTGAVVMATNEPGELKFGEKIVRLD